MSIVIKSVLCADLFELMPSKTCVRLISKVFVECNGQNTFCVGEKLCSLVSEFGKVCKRRKLRVNAGKSKVMSWSRCGNGGRTHVILNCALLEEVDCFKFLGSHVAAD